MWFFNAIFIFGLFGFPALGIRGAAIATLIARIMELVLVCGYAKIYNKDVKFRVHYFLHQDKLLVRDFLVYSLPVVLNEVMWGLGTSANTAVLGHMGSSAVAANSVAQVARQLATVVSFGLSSATAIYLGKTIGERKIRSCKSLCQTVYHFKCGDGSDRRRIDLNCISSCNFFLILKCNCKILSENDVLCDVLFCDRAGI